MEGEILERARAIAGKIEVALTEAGFQVEIEESEYGLMTIRANRHIRAEIRERYEDGGLFSKSKRLGKLSITVYDNGRGKAYPERKDGTFHPELIQRIVYAARDDQARNEEYQARSHELDTANAILRAKGIEYNPYISSSVLDVDGELVAAFRLDVRLPMAKLEQALALLETEK